MQYDTTTSNDRTDTGRPPYDCPSCDRPTLVSTPDELVDYECLVCGERVRERG